MKLSTCLFLPYLLLCLSVAAQPKRLTLPDINQLALYQSLDAKISQNQLRSGYWNYSSFKASLLPKISLSGSIPNYNRSINKVTKPTGEDIFITRNISYSSLMMAVDQNVPFTGGKFSFYSSLSRIDLFNDPSETRQQYSGIPFSISYVQDLLFYNPLKWEKRLQPLIYEESRRDFVERMEEINITATEKFFNVLLVEMQLKLDEQNLRNADTLYRVTEQKFGIGSRDRNDLLQARLGQLTAKNSYSRDQLNHEVARQDLLRFLKLSLYDSIVFVIPEAGNLKKIDVERALKEASANRKKVIEFERRAGEARQRVMEAKALNAPKISVNANLGLSQTDARLSKAYQNLQRQQDISLSLYVPLVDWGVGRSNVKRMKADQLLQDYTIEQEKLFFEQEIISRVLEWNLLAEQIEAARESSRIALERLGIMKQKYMLGSINFTELNNAIQEKDMSANNYLQQLRLYWISYYNIRKITLFDFNEMKPVSYYDLEKEIFKTLK